MILIYVERRGKRQVVNANYVERKWTEGER